MLSRDSREERHFPFTLLIRFHRKIRAKIFFSVEFFFFFFFSLCVLINVIWQICVNFHQQLEILHVRNVYCR